MYLLTCLSDLTPTYLAIFFFFITEQLPTDFVKQIDFNGMSIHLWLFHALRLGNHIHYILVFFVKLFLKNIFAYNNIISSISI